MMTKVTITKCEEEISKSWAVHSSALRTSRNVKVQRRRRATALPGDKELVFKQSRELIRFSRRLRSKVKK